MFTSVAREGPVDPERSVRVGIRTCFNGEHSHGMTILHADEVQRMTAEEAAGTIRAAVGGGPAYLTFDIDCLDPSAAPGTGTPVPGGLAFHQAVSVIAAAVRRGCRIVSCDLNEVAPRDGDGEWNANVGARMLYKLIGHALASQRGG